MSGVGFKLARKRQPYSRDGMDERPGKIPTHNSVYDVRFTLDLLRDKQILL